MQPAELTHHDAINLITLHRQTLRAARHAISMTRPSMHTVLQSITPTAARSMTVLARRHPDNSFSRTTLSHALSLVLNLSVPFATTSLTSSGPQLPIAYLTAAKPGDIAAYHALKGLCKARLKLFQRHVIYHSEDPACAGQRVLSLATHLALRRHAGHE